MNELFSHPSFIVFIISSATVAIINYTILRVAVANITKIVEQIQKELEQEKEKNTELEKTLLREYLRKEDFLAFQNKVEARMEMKLEKLEEKIEKLLRKVEEKK